MKVRQRTAGFFAVLGLAFGCSESAGGPEYASLAVRVENAAGEVTEPYCSVLPVMPGGRIEQELRVEEAFVITLSGNRDAIDVTFSGVVDADSARRSFSHSELRRTTSDAYTVTTPSGQEYLVMLSAPCAGNQ
jgi:hypothetical protein